MNTRTREWLDALHVNPREAIRTLLLLMLAVAIPSLGLPQYVTGPLVNALLIISVETMGLTRALWVGVAPSLVAWGTGVLPGSLLAMIPFIVAGNAVLTTAFATLRRINYWLGIAVGALLKCAWLWLAVTFATVRPFSLQMDGAVREILIPPAMAQMLTWPQLVTALAGGVLAYGFLQALRIGRDR